MGSKKPTKQCSRCTERKPKDRENFPLDASSADGFRSECRECKRAADAVSKQDRRDARHAAAAIERLASDHAPLKVGDFDVSALNAGKRDPLADKEKKQEFSTLMGEVSTALRESGGNAAKMPEHLGTFVGALAEQERRFQNRRGARSISLTMANEVLHLGQLRAFCEQHLSNKIAPRGYALKKPDKAQKRSVVLMLSDQHLGAELSAVDNPVPYGATQEARRLEFVLRQAMEFKPQYRAQSEIVVLILGDMIEGLLLHDMRDGAPLAEQQVIFWTYYREFIAQLSRAYPRVRVVCQPGNHGRNIARHPGRATSSKWDSHEWTMYYALQCMSSGLANVEFDIAFRAVSMVDLQGHNLLATHSDTEVKIGHPLTKASANALELDRLNANKTYGARFDAFAAGHWHTGCALPGVPGRSVAQVYNAALLPPNGHARTSGYGHQPCGQYLWEAVEGHPVGDLRFLGVDERTDADERLGTIIKPFRLFP
jgi:hypothetical protein